MHSSHQRSSARGSAVDRFAEWLLAMCPFSTLTILALLVLGFAIAVPREPAVVAAAVTADVLLNLARRRRRRNDARRSRVATA